MDARLLRYYNEELRYLRELGGEFAREFPKIASRLGMEGLEVADPYVERLLEGAAFLAARVQLKQDAEFPRLSHRLLELVYPNFLAPVPSMLVAQVSPVVDPNLLAGPVVPRDTPLLGPAVALSSHRCEFRTTQKLQLTPLSVASASYVLNVSDLGVAGLQLPQGERPRASLRLTLQLPAGMKLGQLKTDRLCLYLGGQTDVAMQLHELLLAGCLGVLAGAPSRNDDAQRRLLPPACLRPVGYAEDEAMLPASLRGMSGMRLIQEYFAFPERFLFVELSGLGPLLKGMEGQALELIFLLSRRADALEGVVSADNFLLNCVPAINLFPKRADRISVDEGHHEFHVVPDRTAPLDFEVYDIVSIHGHEEQGGERRFQPLYAPGQAAVGEQPAYYTVWREPRLLSETARREGPRSSYIGSEVFIALVDPNDAPHSLQLRQLSVQTRCTNRDLPVFMPGASRAGDYTLDAGLPLTGVRPVAGPSRPFTALREGGVAWRLLNLLSMNYLSLLDTAGGEAAAALRNLLSRFPQGQDPSVRRQIESLHDVKTRAVVRRHPLPGPIAFGRGIEVTLTVDEIGHAGGSAYLFGATLHEYLSRHASLNSFVETVLVSASRGPVARFAPMRGARAVI